MPSAIDPTLRARHRLRLAAAGSVALLLLGPPMAAAAAPARPPRVAVAPNQIFSAEVNGRDGVTQPVTIQMACFGPVTPGETGHPMGHQTLAVFLRHHPRPRFGDTGANGTQIGAFFGAPPPAAARAASGPVWFTHYRTKALPTSEVLPCSGSGHVIFVPLPMSPGTEQTVDVPVDYAGQP